MVRTVVEGDSKKSVDGV